MSKLINGLLLFMCVNIHISAETHITGDITGMTFESSGNPFIVEQDILIPAESKAVIKSGCIFLFKPFTGLTVHGHLLVEGTTEEPVVFSSINDGEFNPLSEQLPNPFDWNGILISRESGTVSLKNFGLRYSVYGIKSQNTDIIIDNGIFKNNGQFHFTINDKIQFVQDNIPYSFNGPESDIGKTTKKVSVSSQTKPSRPSSTTRTILRYTSFGVGLIGTGFGIYSGIEMGKAYNDMEIANLQHGDETGYADARDRFKRMRTVAIISGTCAVLGYTGFTLTFFY